MKPRYFTREVTATQTFLACAHCGTEQPAEYDGVLAHYCISCSAEITHNELCPHCYTHGTDDELALFSTFEFCPLCAGVLTPPAAEPA